MERSILHMDLDSFFVSVECLLNPKLAGKPLLIGGNSNRSVVSSCSYEARRFGVRSAMPVRMAQQLCPDILVVRGDYENYTRYSAMVTEIVKESVPVYEKASIDEFYADLSGMERFHNSYLLATELRKKIMRETGLPISFGLSQNKVVSKIATGEAKPNGQLKIDHGSEKKFLAPLSVRKIPMVGEKTCAVLHSMGIEKIKSLQQMSVETLQTVFGQSGIFIWERANGIDDSPVEPYSERKSISSECTFAQDTLDVAFLKNKLVGICEELGYSLRSEEKLASCLAIKIRYSNFDTHSRQMMIPFTAIDEHLIVKAKELFDQLYKRDMLVRLIGLRVSHLIHGHPQIDLFEGTEEKIKLYQAMDKINNRFGAQTIRRSGQS